MSEDLDTARRYRAHARELRAIATGKAATPNRDALLEVAKDYEEMAEALEGMHQASDPDATAKFL
jgi:hypothetical protein